MPDRTEVFDVLNKLGATFDGAEQYPPWLLRLAACSSFPQFCATLRAELEPETYCPFCPTELERRGRTILKETRTALLIENDFPRKDTERMLLVVPRRHVADSFLHLNDEQFRDMFVLVRSAVRDHGVSDGALILRFGNPLYHAGTIAHLHLNLIRPIPGNGCTAPLAKQLMGPYGYQADHERLLYFMTELRLAGGEEWLFSEQGVAAVKIAR